MPVDANVILPAEWSRQSGVMLTWPHSKTDWQPYLNQVESVFVDIAEQITLRQQLIICAVDTAHQQHIQQQLSHSETNVENIHFYHVNSNDSWVRDHGPITILSDGKPSLLDFTFNAWGNKFQAQLDNQITRKLYDQGAFGNCKIESIDLILEGGAIESDGHGTLLTTSACLLSANRNPHLSKQQVEKKLCELFGLTRILWLDHGYLSGDDTDSHIDTLARFCSERCIIYVACDDPQDEHYHELRAMEQQLQAMRTQDDMAYQLIPLPWPNEKRNDDGDRLPASYANFLIINDAVLVPTYDDPHDSIAIERVQQGFPDHQIIGIPCLPLIQQSGSLHCVTMQLPEGLLSLQPTSESLP